MTSDFRVSVMINAHVIVYTFVLKEAFACYLDYTSVLSIFLKIPT